MTERLSTLFTFTGPPAVGKTTAVDTLERMCSSNGLTIFKAYDYPHLKKFAQKKRGHEHIVFWPVGSGKNSDDFMIKPDAYQEASTAVSIALASEIQSKVGDCSVIATEVARGAGTGRMRDRYDIHFFSILSPTLSQIVRLANIQLNVPDTTELLRRATYRYESSGHKAPPPEVVEKYIYPDGSVQSSIEAAENSGFEIAYNGLVDNSRGPAITIATLGNIFAEVI